VGLFVSPGGRHSSHTPRDLGESMSDCSNTNAGPGKVRLELSFRDLGNISSCSHVRFTIN